MDITELILEQHHEQRRTFALLDDIELDDEVEDAVHDHDDIRDGITKVRQHREGTEGWWAAVRETRAANSDHMAEEEREDLADFRRHADLQTRHEIALQFIAFESEHAEGVPLQTQDPTAYVERGGRA